MELRYAPLIHSRNKLKFFSEIKNNWYELLMHFDKPKLPYRSEDQLHIITFDVLHNIIDLQLMDYLLQYLFSKKSQVSRHFVKHM